MLPDAFQPSCPPAVPDGATSLTAALSPPEHQATDAENQPRRTFAIIAHPDAGKTTLTEKLLLLGGAIHLAGQVKARGERRRARSDWMKIEQDRGISVTTRSEEHTSELQSLMRISYAVFCLKNTRQYHTPKQQA